MPTAPVAPATARCFGSWLMIGIRLTRAAILRLLEENATEWQAAAFPSRGAEQGHVSDLTLLNATIHCRKIPASCSKTVNPTTYSMKRIFMIATLSAAALFMGACATKSSCSTGGKSCCPETSCCGSCGGSACKK